LHAIALDIAIPLLQQSLCFHFCWSPAVLPTRADHLRLLPSQHPPPFASSPREQFRYFRPAVISKPRLFHPPGRPPLVPAFHRWLPLSRHHHCTSRSNSFRLRHIDLGHLFRSHQDKLKRASKLKTHLLLANNRSKGKALGWMLQREGRTTLRLRHPPCETSIL